MKRTPLWLLWVGLALTVWVAAAWLIWGVLEPRDKAFHTEMENLKRQQTEGQTLMAAAPRVVAKLDSIETEIRNQLARLTTTNDITRLLSELEEEGLRHKLDAVRAELGLHSTMSIPLENEHATDTGLATHSLRLALGIQGTFQAIGSWLDAVEDRADFHEWIECRWEHKDDVGRISFSGEAEFWIISAPAATTTTLGDLGK